MKSRFFKEKKTVWVCVCECDCIRMWMDKRATMFHLWHSNTIRRTIKRHMPLMNVKSNQKCLWSKINVQRTARKRWTIKFKNIECILRTTSNRYIDWMSELIVLCCVKKNESNWKQAETKKKLQIEFNAQCESIQWNKQQTKDSLSLCVCVFVCQFKCYCHSQMWSTIWFASNCQWFYQIINGEQRFCNKMVVKTLLTQWNHKQCECWRMAFHNFNVIWIVDERQKKRKRMREWGDFKQSTKITKTWCNCVMLWLRAELQGLRRMWMYLLQICCYRRSEIKSL